jgi:NADPH:quinone reductase-like Zn-dependent oxidoreductase
MKAVICTKYGAPEVLKIMDVEKPIPKSDELLIKIKASAVNSGDTRVRKLEAKEPIRFIMRFVLGFKKPRNPILGSTFSGVVEEKGTKVEGFHIGDEVFGVTGFKMGAHAEYTTVSEKSIITKKPVNATFEEAAAILFGGQTAIYFLEKAKIKENENLKILIYGATGSVGTAAIQVANYYNAQVTAVCSEAGQNLAKELGAKDIILYDKEDFTKRHEKYDIIFDAIGKISKKQCAPLLKDGSYYVTVSEPNIAKEYIEQVELLRLMFDTGKYKAVIDRVYSMEDIIEAHRYVDTGRKKGFVTAYLTSKQ